MRVLNWFKENYILTAILALATFLRIYKVDYQSIWTDEILSMNNSDPKLTFKQLYDSVLFWDYLPHLYFYLLRIAFEIFGFTTMVARMLSAIIGIVGVYSIYLLGKEIFNKRVGLIAALFLSVNYFHIYYSQEVRPYGLLFLFSTLSFYRLVVFIKDSSLKNAIYYGIFTGLIINAHFFGFITIFSQCLLLLYFIIKSEPENRKKLFINSVIAGIIAILVILPGYAAILRMLEIKSFWLATPTADVYSNLLKEVLGNSEMIWYAATVVFISYFIAIFNQKEKDDSKSLKNNKLIFSSIILFFWLATSLLIPLIKSHLDVSMIVSRYFISVVATLLVALAIGVDLIKNNTIKGIVILYVALFSVVDLFVVKKYYSTPQKAQFRELIEAIKKKNSDNVKVVTPWNWLLPYFLQDRPEIKIENSAAIKDYISNVKNGTTKPSSFWFLDIATSKIELPPDLQQYLDETFYLKERLEFKDVWANYYVPKIEAENKVNANEFGLSMFSPGKVDSQGSMTLLENANLRTEFITLEKGTYNMVINATSLPDKPINGENAHFKIKLNGIEIANYYVSEKPDASQKVIPFAYDKNEKVRFQLIYDNDILIDGKDRNVIIRSIKLQKNN